MEFIEVIQKRHSVRKFTGEPIERELLDAILDIAATAPSSKNSHSSAFMVVDDKDTLSAISEMRDRGSAFVKDAAAAIVVMDLGSCWVHVRDRLRSKADPSKGTAEEYLRSLLGIRDEYSVLCVVALGHEALPEE